MVSPNLTPPHQGLTLLIEILDFSMYHFAGTVLLFITLMWPVALSSSSIVFTLASTAPAQAYKFCSIPLTVCLGIPKSVQHATPTLLHAASLHCCSHRTAYLLHQVKC